MQSFPTGMSSSMRHSTVQVEEMDENGNPQPSATAKSHVATAAGGQTAAAEAHALQLRCGRVQPHADTETSAEHGKGTAAAPLGSPGTKAPVTDGSATKTDLSLSGILQDTTALLASKKERAAAGRAGAKRRPARKRRKITEAEGEEEEGRDEAEAAEEEESDDEEEKSPRAVAKPKVAPKLKVAPKAEASASAAAAIGFEYPMDKKLLEYTSPRKGRKPIHYGRITIYTDMSRSMWRLKPGPSSTKLSHWSWRKEAKKEVWGNLVKEVKRLTR